MKRQIILLMLIFLLGGLVIFLPSFLEPFLKGKEADRIQAQKLEDQEYMKEIGTNFSSTEELELSFEERETEAYNQEQMFFEGIEKLYDYLLFGQVEDIKEQIQFYVHQYISKDLLDCRLIAESIKESKDTIIFKLEMTNVSSFEVNISKYNNGETLDITILHSLK